MIKNDNLYFGDKASEKMMDGVRKVAEAVGITMGTSGKNSIIEAVERPGYLVTNDGFAIANSIVLADPLEELGHKQLVEAINRANKSSGDGSSTTCVLTSAILEEGRKHLNSASPMEIKRSIEACIPLIEESIKAQTKTVGVDNVEAVATISAEDPEIGKRIQEIYKQIGPKGVIQWDISKTPEDSYTIGTGLTVHGAGYMSRYMCDLGESGFSSEARLINPLILLVRRKITSTTDFDKLFETIFNKDIKEIVVFVEDIEPPVINAIIQARQKIGFRAVVIKMPVIWADEWWEDLAEATGATLINAASGIKMRDIRMEHLGTTEHLVVDKEDTVIDGIKDLSLYIAKIKEEGTDEAFQRAERLNVKTARYFVGAHSESALAYRRLKTEDSINAASSALENGIVVGGAKALYNAAQSLPDNTVGSVILRRALEAPMRQIIANTGLNPEEIIKQIDAT